MNTLQNFCTSCTPQTKLFDITYWCRENRFSLLTNVFSHLAYWFNYNESNKIVQNYPIEIMYVRDFYIHCWNEWICLLKNISIKDAISWLPVFQK